MKKPLLLGIILTVCVIIVAFVFAQVYPEGMISYWKFDEGVGTTAYDSVDVNDGTLINDPVWTSGQVGGALRFDGVDDYVELPASNSILTDSPFTISAWIITYVQQGDYGPGEGRIVNLHRWDDYSTSASIYAGGPAGGESGDRDDICFLYYTGTVHKWLCYQTTSPVYHDGYPHLITATHNGSTVKLYYDGVEVRTRTDTFGTFGTATAKIGSFNGSVRYFNGCIDEVAIYDRALTACEISQHYNNGLVGKGYTPYTPEDAIETLIISVGGLDLPKGTKNSLTSKLDNVLDSLEKGRDNAAKNKLEAFINEVEAQRGKKLTDEQADALIIAAQCIIDNI